MKNNFNRINKIQNTLLITENIELYENKIKQLIIKDIQKILRKNNYIVSISIVKYEFKNLIDFIYNNIIFSIINDENDYNFYVIDELNLTINNTELLFNKYFNGVYSEFNKNDVIVSIN